MIDSNVSLDLMEFIEAEILPRYTNFDRAHNLIHVKRVIASSLRIAKRLGVNIDIVYVIAAYHDLGLEGPRAIHHITSGKIVKSDNRLKRWFTDNQINIIKEAVEDHRASASHAPRSIYGKIIAEADRDLAPNSVFLRTIEYGLDHYPNKDKEEQWQRFREHLSNKYSENGYIKLWIPGSENEMLLNEIRKITNDQEKLRAIFESMYKDLLQK